MTVTKHRLGYIRLTDSWRIYSKLQFWLELHDRDGQNGEVAEYHPNNGVLDATGMIPLEHWSTFLRVVEQLTKLYPCCAPVSHLQGGYHVNEMAAYVEPPEFEGWEHHNAFGDYKLSQLDVLRPIAEALGLELVECDDKWRPIQQSA